MEIELRLDSITVLGRKLVELERARLPADAEALDPLREFAIGLADKPAPVVLRVDGRVPGATLLALVQTLREPGLPRWGFVVASEAGERFLPVTEPRPAAAGSDAPQWTRTLSLRVADTGTYVWTGAWSGLGLAAISDAPPAAGPLLLQAEDCRLARLDDAALEQLDRAAAELCTENGGRLVVELAVGTSAPAGEVLRALTVARREGCEGAATLAALELVAPAPSCDPITNGEAGPKASGFSGPLLLDRPRVRGSFARELVERVTRRKLAKLRTCSEGAPSGELDLRYVVTQSGAVDKLEIRDNSSSPTFARCIEEVVSGLRFPGTEGGIVIVEQRVRVFAPDDR